MKPCSLYVISTMIDGTPSAPIKIGIARNPIRRLADCQTASPNELVLSLDIKLWSRDMASGIEKACHALGKHLGVNLRGEWLNLPPGNVGGLIGCGMDIACNSRIVNDWAAYSKEVRRQAEIWKRGQEWVASLKVAQG